MGKANASTLQTDTVHQHAYTALISAAVRGKPMLEAGKLCIRRFVRKTGH